MPVKFTNNAVGTLASPISDLDVSLVLGGTEGSRFPSLGSGDYFFATIIDEDGNREIVKVTARVDNILTVERGQEGTAARAFPSGSQVSHRLTAGALNEIITELKTLAAQFEQYRDDLSGAIVTGGTSTAYTVTTNEGFNSLVDGLKVTARMHATSGANPTLQVDGLTARNIRLVSGTNLPAGMLLEGGIYTFTYSSSDTAWIVHNARPQTPNLDTIEGLSGSGVLRRAQDEEGFGWSLDAGVEHLAAETPESVIGTDGQGKLGAKTPVGLKVASGELQYDIPSLDTDGNPDGSNDYAITHDASAGKAKKTLLGLLPGALIALIEDNRSSGADPGGMSGTATRQLNTLVYNRNNLVSLSNNRFTLPAGTWEIEWFASAYFGNVAGTHQSFLYNVTDSAEVKRGTLSAFDEGDGSDGASANSSGCAVVTISSNKAFEIRSQVSTGARQSPGSSWGTIVPVRVTIRRA